MKEPHKGLFEAVRVGKQGGGKSCRLVPREAQAGA